MPSQIQAQGQLVAAGHLSYYEDFTPASGTLPVAWSIPPYTSEQPQPTKTTTIIDCARYLSLHIEGEAPDGGATVTVEQRAYPHEDDNQGWLTLGTKSLSGILEEVYSGTVRAHQIRVTTDARVKLALILKG